jgi:hypothetical protein
MRFILACLLSSAAYSAPITFDFETLPDSAGCSETVSSYDDDRGLEVCNRDWIIDNNFAGISAPHVDTENGLTMDIQTTFSSSIWWRGAYICGNAPICGPFVASFSSPLDSITVAFQGIGTADAPFAEEATDFSYSVSAYSGEYGTGALLGTAAVLDIPLPTAPGEYFAFPLALSLTNVGAIRSVSIAGMVLTPEGIHNLARIEAIHAVPEPGALVLLLALLGFRRGSAGAGGPRWKGSDQPG